MIRPRALPKCSAAVADVDGTLVNDEKRLTSRVISAVAELRVSGIVFSIISSRPPRGLRRLLGPRGITTPVAGFNGVMVAANDLRARRAANFVTDSNHEKGFANAVKRLVLGGRCDRAEAARVGGRA